jgi:beta-glucosidase
VRSVVRPIKELKGFEKIELDVGESKTVEFEITEQTLKYWTKRMKFEAESGKFEVFIGKSSACKSFASFELID